MPEPFPPSTPLYLSDRGFAATRCGLALVDIAATRGTAIQTMQIVQRARQNLRFKKGPIILMLIGYGTTNHCPFMVMISNIAPPPAPARQNDLPLLAGVPASGVEPIDAFCCQSGKDHTLREFCCFLGCNHLR